MTKDVQTVSPETSMHEAIAKMVRHKIRRLVVLSTEGRIIGIVSEGDIAKNYPSNVNPFSAAGPESIPGAKDVRGILSKNVITISQNQPLEEAAKVMADYHVGGLPVEHDNKLVGIITESDIFRAFVRILSSEEGTARITFGLSENENILSFLIELVKKHNVKLLSFLNYQSQGRNFGVAKISGRQIQGFVDELWDSGHSVENVLRK